LNKIRLNIAGAFIYFDKLFPFILKNKLHKKFNLMVYDSVDYCPWNGGRINYKNNASEEKIKKYNKYGISVGLSFSNFRIDLNNELGNQFLEYLYYYKKKFKVQNSIFLINEEFREYLRKKYDFLLKFSIVGHPDYLTDYPNINKAVEFYKDKEKKYDIIVPKRFYIDKEWFLKNLNLNKYEVLFNYGCKFDCKIFYTHFEAIASQNLIPEKYNYLVNKKIGPCWIKDQDPYEIDTSEKFYKKLRKFGYTKFKIAGRDTNFSELKQDLIKFKNIN